MNFLQYPTWRMRQLQASIAVSSGAFCRVATMDDASTADGPASHLTRARTSYSRRDGAAFCSSLFGVLKSGL